MDTSGTRIKHVLIGLNNFFPLPVFFFQCFKLSGLQGYVTLGFLKLLYKKNHASNYFRKSNSLVDFPVLSARTQWLVQTSTVGNAAQHHSYITM